MKRFTNDEISDDGWPLLALAGLITIFLTFVALPLGCFSCGILFWLSHILRVPRRLAVSKKNVIVAPVDGCIVEIIRCDTYNGIIQKSYSWRITIRTKLTDLQFQTSPANGYLLDNTLFPGMFNSWPGIDEGLEISKPNEWLDAREFNERRELTIQTGSGHIVLLVQLATKTARQLVCRLVEGKNLTIGDPLGMARIGGVTDIYLPPRSNCLVATGMHVVASETILATLPPSQIQMAKNV